MTDAATSDENLKDEPAKDAASEEATPRPDTSSEAKPNPRLTAFLARMDEELGDQKGRS